MEQVMKCGDLLTLKTLVERMKATAARRGDPEGATKSHGNPRRKGSLKVS